MRGPNVVLEAGFLVPCKICAIFELSLSKERKANQLMLGE